MELKKGDVVKRKDGKPFISTGSHELNPAYKLKVRDVKAGQVWVEYRLGWRHPEDLIKAED